MVKNSHRIDSGEIGEDMEIKMISVDKIRPNPFQPRETFDKEKIKELADSIKGEDLVQPILVRKKGRTYQIIAGERRWRAYQFAKLKRIPAIEREADDMEARELSLIENWHRLRLDPIEAENFIATLYEDGVKAGRYKSILDMSRKTGIPRQTLDALVSAYKEKANQKLPSMATYEDVERTTPLRDQPELRKKVLKLRVKGKIRAENLREFAKTTKEVSEPIRDALLKEDSKLTPVEARVIDVELPTPSEKMRVIEELEKERSSERVKSHIEFIRWMGQEKEREAKIVETATGDVWTCPICNKEYRLIHVEPEGTHRFKEVEK